MPSKLTKQDLERMDEQLKPLHIQKEIDGKIRNYIPRENIYSWLVMKGAMIYVSDNGVRTPVITKTFERGRLLYQVLLDDFEAYCSWESKGRQLEDISNFGIKNDNSGTQRENKTVTEVREEIQGHSEFDADIPFGGEDKTSV